MKLSKRGKEIRKTTSHLVFLLFFFLAFAFMNVWLFVGSPRSVETGVLGVHARQWQWIKKKKEKEKGDGAKRMSIIC